jgi:hypothetical protein
MHFLIFLYASLLDLPAIYEDKIYGSVATWMVVSALLAFLFFYYVLGWFRARFSTTGHWLLALAILIILNILLAVCVVGASDAQEAHVFSTDMLQLCLMNALFAATFFFLLTLVFKWWSPNAKKTPF